MDTQCIDLKFHHIGQVVENIEVSKQYYSNILNLKEFSDTIFVKSQDVNVCFIKNGEESYIELIEPANENSGVNSLLKKRLTYYHIAYTVFDIEKTVNHLENNNFKALKYFNSEAFNNKRCIFLYTPDNALIELIEK